VTVGEVWSLEAPPRRWQREAVEAWVSADHRGIVGVVTGAGKTVFAELCMLRFRAGSPSGRVVIIVPTLALLDQWFVSLREDLHVPEDEIATYSGEGRASEPKPVNLVVLNTARDAAPEIASSGPTFLIVDECHRAASPENLKSLEGDHEATLGMSATPERDYDDWLDEVLIPRLGQIVYRYDYQQARVDGVIAPFDLVNVEVELNEREQAAYGVLSNRVARLIRRRADGEDVDGQLRRTLQSRAAVSATASMRVPAAVRLVERHRGDRTLVFHERIANAEAIYRFLESRGGRATIYHSGVDPAVRRDNLRLFRRGVFDVLVTCRALDEGVNVPETRVAVIASSTASVRQRIQRLGRVLRPAPGKDAALVYTVFATDVERRRLEQDAGAAGADSVEWMRVALEAGQASGAGDG